MKISTKKMKGFAFRLTFLITLISANLKAQLTGTKNIPGDYGTLSAAIIDLNAQGVGAGGVTLNLISGNPENAPAGGYSITASGSSANPVVIQGNANVITAPTPQVSGLLNDAIFKIVGGDYITITGFIMMENAANTTTVAGTNNMTEFGVSLNYATATDGAQNISIVSNTITLNRNYQNTFGIYSNSTHNLTSVTVAASATSIPGANNNLNIYSNSISNVNMGIAVIGSTVAANYNNGLNIGGSSSLANTISDFGTTSAISGYQNVSGTVNGILVKNTGNFNISNNSVMSSNGGTIAGTLNGIQIATYSNAPTVAYLQAINNNTLSLRSGNAGGTINGINIAAATSAASSSISVNGNDFNTFGHTVTGSGVITFITNAMPAGVTNINGNTFSNISVNTTGNITFISNSVTRPANALCNVNSNSIIGSFAKTGAGGTVTFYNSNSTTPNSATENNTGNNFSNMTFTGATTISGWISTDGSTTSPFGPSKNVNGNMFTNIVGGSSSVTLLNVGYSNASNANAVSGNTIQTISGGGNVTGIASAAGVQNIFSNTVGTLMSSGASAVTGISISGGSVQNVFWNKIYDLSGSNVSSTVSGVTFSGGTTNNLYNNIIGDLRTPAASAANPLTGISVTNGTNSNIYFNTVYLNASSSGTNFGSSAVSTNTTTVINLRSNIFVNNSVPNGTGISVAYRRSGNSTANYNSASNNNLFYAGTPSATNAIFTDGTNTYTTIAAYKTAMAIRDQSSVSENPTFLSTSGSSANFLHINPAVQTVIESGGVNTGGVTSDFDMETRQGNPGYTGTGTAPDIGADEFEGTTSAMVINNVSITPSGNLCVASSRNITANITPGGLPLTAVTLNYSFNGSAQTPITMTGGNVSTTSTWNATIPAATPGNAMVTWTVMATDGTNTKSTAGTAYSDEPMTGIVVTASASPISICAGSTSTLSVMSPGAITLGSGASTTSGSGTSGGNNVSPYSHYYGGNRFQYMIKASELTALGLLPGNITSLAFDVTSAGTTYTGFTISMTQTNTAVMSGGFVNSGLTQVYTSNVTPVTGINTYAFSTPFNWDGTSNVVIQVCWSNNNGGGLAAEVKYDNTPFVSEFYARVDNVLPASACGGTAASGSTSMRPKMILNGNKLSAGYAINWSNGTSSVGTTNNVVVSPTVNTTYSATLTDGNGCSTTSSPVTVTVTPLPSAPTAVNSSQCGVGVPTSSVSGGTSYNWYASPTSTTVLQSGIETNYTTAIGASTTWYVTSVNGTCESSPRIAVTTTVSIPDAVTASTSASNLCVGGSNTVTLTAVQTGTTNPYTFSWDASPVSGSGMPATVPGATVTVTPTLPGTYSYSVTATDGICTTVASVTVALNSLPNISGATATPSAICSGSTFSLNASSIISGPQAAPTGYCAPTSGGSGCITSVSLNTLNRTSVCETGFYMNVPASITTNVTPGQTYTLSLNTDASAITSVWFDWNRDGVFTAGEWYQPFITGTTGTSTITVPANAGLGLTRMRVRSRLTGNANGSTDACSSFGSGEAEDYTINVQIDQSSDYTWTWNPGALSGSSIATSATNTTSSAVTEVYTVTATNTITGCSNTATAGIVVNPVPSTPVATDATQCGVGVPTASVSGGTSYYWYAAPTSTTVLQSGSSATFTASIGNTTTWYVASFNGSCFSTRVALTQSVTTPPAFTVNSPAAICAGSEIGTFSVTSNVSDYDSYVWSPVTDIYSDASATTAYTGSNASQVYVKSLTPGILTINVSATNSVSGCAAVATTSISVKSAPITISVSATPTLICAGNTTTLTAGATPLPVVLLNEGFNGTTNNWTTINTSTGGTASAAAWTLRNSPYSSNVGTGITSNDASQFYLTDSDAQGSGGTTGTILQSPAINTMGFSSLNLSFFHYYNYYTSDVSAKVEVSTNGTTWTSLQDYKTGAVDIGTPTAFTMATFNLNTYINKPTVYVRFNYNSAYGYGWAVDNVMINGMSSNAYDFSWTSTPAGFTSSNSTATDMPAATTDYSVVITNTTTACSNSGVVTVSVNPIPMVMAMSSSTAVCAGNSATLTAMGATNYTWSSGGTTPTEVVTPAVMTTYTLFGESNGCVGSNAVTVDVNSLPIVTAMASNTLLCSNLGESAVLTASTSATSYTWSNGANTMTTTVTPNTGTTYTVTVNDGTCDGMATIFVDAQICAGLNAITSVSEINIYPNPTNGVLNISISSELAGNTSVEVYDALGKLVIKDALSNDANTINLSKLEDGMYVFKIINNNKAIKVGKVVKQ